jgi:1,4-dihydroxy-2-naphthoate polyprenyltransferase
MNKIKAWIQASRLPSQSYIFLPLLMGQGYAVMELEIGFDWAIFFWTVLFSVVIQLYIVYGNDYNDLETDRLNRTFNVFSGGSRVLVEGRLSRRELAIGIWLMVVLNLFVGSVLTFSYKRYFTLPIILLSMFLLYLYSFRPFRLNYLGGGEFLQIIGVAGILPIIGYYAQSNVIHLLQLPWTLVLILLPFQLGNAISTALPDYPSDKTGHKKTIVVLLGPQKSKYLIILLNFFSMILFVLIGWTGLAEYVTYTIILGPFIANLMMISLIQRSEAGTPRLTAFVALNVVGVTILFNLMMVFYLF